MRLERGCGEFEKQEGRQQERNRMPLEATCCRRTLRATASETKPKQKKQFALMGMRLRWMGSVPVWMGCRELKNNLAPAADGSSAVVKQIWRKMIGP